MSVSGQRPDDSRVTILRPSPTNSGESEVETKATEDRLIHGYTVTTTQGPSDTFSIWWRAAFDLTAISGEVESDANRFSIQGIMQQVRDNTNGVGYMDHPGTHHDFPEPYLWPDGFALTFNINVQTSSDASLTLLIFYEEI